MNRRLTTAAFLCLMLASQGTAQYRVTDNGIGGYFKLVLEGISVRGENGLVTGLGFGFVIKQRTFIGLGGYGLFSSNITTTTLDLPVTGSPRLYLVWGGVEIEHDIIRTGSVRAGLTSLIGIGNVEVEEQLFGRIVEEVRVGGGNAGQKSSKDNFYLFDPGVAVSFFPDSWLQISVRGAYRLPFGVSYLTMTNSDIGGFLWGLRVSVGSF